MQYRSPIKCQSTVATKDGAAPCRKGAIYKTSIGTCLCDSHFRQWIMSDYMVAHPECVLTATVTVGGQKYETSMEKLAVVMEILNG